jgi:hypothetical protein
MGVILFRTTEIMYIEVQNCKTWRVALVVACTLIHQSESATKCQLPTKKDWSRELRGRNCFYSERVGKKLISVSKQSKQGRLNKERKQSIIIHMRYESKLQSEGLFPS